MTFNKELKLKAPIFKDYGFSLQEAFNKGKQETTEHYRDKSFKERANEVKEGQEKAAPGIIVTLNPDKPRRGCFEIREEGSKTLISLLVKPFDSSHCDIKKPFTKMTELDMEEVVANIQENIK